MILLALVAAVQTPPPVVLRPAPLPSPAPPIASAPLDDGSGQVVDLYINGERATLILRDTVRQQPLTDPQVVLALLADKRMAPLWQPLLDWAGPGLERMRDRRLEAVRGVVADGRTDLATTTAASSVRPKVRATLLLADALAAAGKLDEAIATVEQARGSAPGRSDWAKAEWMATSVRLHTLTRRARGIPAAIAVLDRAEAALGAAHPYSVNFQINRAADLAESGRYADALTALDAAEARFADPQGRRGSDGQRVPGSDRQFAWIRICALSGLGRGAENASLLQTIYPAFEPITHGEAVGRGAFYVPATPSIRLRLFRCMNNPAGVADEFVAELKQSVVGGSAFLQLQPAFRDDEKPASFYRAVAADPRLIEALRGRFRALPPALWPALNKWRADRSPS